MTAFDSALVSGGTGFVGRSLVRRLVADGARVTCLVRPESSGVEQLTASGVETVALDELERLGDAPANVAFNLASYGVRPGDRDPRTLDEGNVGVLARMIGVAARWPSARVVHIGSCSEYAPIDEPALLSEEHPLEPRSAYGGAKAAAHVFGAALARELGVAMVTLRLFGTYGPGEADHRLIPHLASRLAKGEQAEMTAGTQARDFTYVDDVVEACIVAASSDQLESYQAYNVCTGTPVRVRELAQLVARLMGKPESLLGIGQREMRPGEPLWMVGDPARFGKSTGWTPRVGLEDGVRRSIERQLSRGES